MIYGGITFFAHSIEVFNLYLYVTERELGGTEGFDLSAVSGKCTHCKREGLYTSVPSKILSLHATKSGKHFIEGRLELSYKGRKGVSSFISCHVTPFISIYFL